MRRSHTLCSTTTAPCTATARATALRAAELRHALSSHCVCSGTTAARATAELRTRSLVCPPGTTIDPHTQNPPIALLKFCARRAAVLFDISQLLQTGLDRKSLETLVGLTECGVNPEALASVVKELRRESAALRAAEEAVEAAGASGSAPDASTR